MQTTDSIKRIGIRVLTAVCLFFHMISKKNDAAGVTKLDIQMFHGDSWKPIHYGDKGSEVKVMSKPAWVFTLLWVLASSSVPVQTWSMKAMWRLMASSYSTFWTSRRFCISRSASLAWRTVSSRCWLYPHKYVGPPYCQAEIYAGCVACCPLVSHGEYADGTDRQRDRRKLLHYACGQHNNCIHTIIAHVHTDVGGNARPTQPPTICGTEICTGESAVMLCNWE